MFFGDDYQKNIKSADLKKQKLELMKIDFLWMAIQKFWFGSFNAND